MNTIIFIIYIKYILKYKNKITIKKSYKSLIWTISSNDTELTKKA